METRESWDSTEAALRNAAESMSDEARSDVRRRVMGSVSSRLRPGFIASNARRIATAMTAVAVLSGGGVAYAANGSLPGQTLYPVKRGMENALVAVLPSGQLERSVLVGLAARRAEEAGKLARRRGASPGDISEVLVQLRESVQSAGGATGLQEQEEVRVRSHVGKVPDWAAEAIDEAISFEKGRGGRNESDTTGTQGGAGGTPSSETGAPQGSGEGSGSPTGGSTGGGSGGVPGSGNDPGPQGTDSAFGK